MARYRVGASASSGGTRCSKPLLAGLIFLAALAAFVLQEVRGGCACL